jgi:hypothetical protein
VPNEVQSAEIQQVISLWGGAAQVASAKELLLGLLDKCTLDAPQQKGAWAKIHAKNAGKEANAEMKERREHAILQLRKEPEVLLAFPEKVSTKMSACKGALTRSSF